jgi:hypothetical protein
MMAALGPGILRERPLHEVLIECAWVGMLFGSVCAVFRMPRVVYAACAAFAVLILGLAAYAAMRDVGIGLTYGTYAVTSVAGFLTLTFATSPTTSNYQHPVGYRRPSRLPGFAFIWSVLASPIGLFWGLFTLFDGFPNRSEMKIVSWIFLVALPITSFAFSASVWCHLDRHSGRLQGRTLATLAWVISSLSLVVALFVGIAMLT